MSAHSIATRGLAGRKIPQGVLAPMNALLFGSGEQGAWYDPSDFSTLFQDSAGTTPVTAVEQPVGRMLDLSGNGNHASQATTTKRGVVSRRVNLLTKSEDFSDAAAWPKVAAGTGVVPVVTPNAALAPNGTMTASQIVFDQGAGTAISDQSFIKQALTTTAVNYDGGLWLRTIAGTATLVFRHASQGPFLSITVTSTWAYFSRSELGLAGAVSFQLGKYSTLATGSSTVLAWGASLTLAIDSHLPYQWVNTATDYDADPNKFPTYIRFDGADDAYQTNSINFTGTDKMTVWAGVAKLSDTPSQMIAEIGPSAESNPGSWFLASQYTAGYNYFVNSLGLAGNGRAVLNSAAPGVSKDYISFQADLSAPYPAGRISVRRNAIAGLTNAGDYGYGGNYGNYPLNIGARAGTSLFFNGRLYNLIVRGAQSSLSQLEAGELLTKSRMKLP